MLEHGIDLHKRTLVIATLDRDGSLVKRRKIPAHRGPLTRYLASLDGPHRAVVEATGSWYWVSANEASSSSSLTPANSRRSHPPR